MIKEIVVGMDGSKVSKAQRMICVSGMRSRRMLKKKGWRRQSVGRTYSQLERRYESRIGIVNCCEELFGITIEASDGNSVILLPNFGAAMTGIVSYDFGISRDIPIHFRNRRRTMIKTLSI